MLPLASSPPLHPHSHVGNLADMLAPCAVCAPQPAGPAASLSDSRGHPPTHPPCCCSLSHVDDLADMMARVPGNAAATREHFNLVSDRCITLDGGWAQVGVCGCGWWGGVWCVRWFVMGGGAGGCCGGCRGGRWVHMGGLGRRQRSGSGSTSAGSCGRREAAAAAAGARSACRAPRHTQAPAPAPHLHARAPPPLHYPLRRHRQGGWCCGGQGREDCALRPCTDGAEEGRGLPLPVGTCLGAELTTKRVLAQHGPSAVWSLPTTPSPSLCSPPPPPPPTHQPAAAAPATSSPPPTRPSACWAGSRSTTS